MIRTCIILFATTLLFSSVTYTAADVIDQKLWCSTKYIRIGSFFSKSNLPLPIALQLFYMWAYDFDNKQIARKSDLDKKTVVDWLNLCRELAKQSRALIAEAAIPGVNIRQCTCEEQRFCVEEMKVQVMACINTCWGRFQEITSHPADLRKCFSRTDTLLEELMTCFEQNVDACLYERAETMIQKINITELFRLGVLQIEKTKTQLTKNVAGPIKKILDTAGNFGICVKDCFVGKNANGFCFDSKDCQPLLVDKKAKKSLRQCTKLIDWKKEAGELCDCSVKAGLTDLHDYCPMLRLIGGGRRQPNING